MGEKAYLYFILGYVGETGRVVNWREIAVTLICMVRRRTARGFEGLPK